MGTFRVAVELPGYTYVLLVALYEEQSEYWEAWQDQMRGMITRTESDNSPEQLHVALEQIDNMHAAAWKTVRGVETLPDGTDKKKWLEKPPKAVYLAFGNNLARLVNEAAKVSRLSDEEGNSSGPSNAPGSGGPKTSQLPAAQSAGPS